MINVIFVCVGNTCRSPMAAAIFNNKYSSIGVAKSFGLTYSKELINPFSVKVLVNNGIINTDNNNYQSHQSTQISKDDIKNADIIYTMTSSVRLQLINIFPLFIDKIKCFPYEVPDPYMGTIDDYQNAYDIISKNLNILFDSNLDYTLAKAERDDLNQIILIENDRFSNPWTVNFTNNLFENPFVYFYVAKKSNNEIIGFVVYTIIANECEIYDIAVDKRYEGLKIGSKLLELVISNAKENDCSTIFLDVRFNNIKAINLYKKYSFDEVGLRKNYYTKPNEDAILMVKNL